MNTLEALKQYTKVVADTGNLDEISALKPEEATTNPTLILKAVQRESEPKCLFEAYDLAKILINNPPSCQQILQACLIVFARKILQIIPGRVSIEVDSRLSFDTQATVEAAKNLIQIAKQAKVDTHRMLIKIAATWEGIQAAKILETLGIACNCTLIFNSVQALACAQAKVTLISPFVGRIYDWHCAHMIDKPIKEDPGVISVKQIYYLLKSQGFCTEIMGASFRNIDEILALAGCDRLTIAPKYIEQMQQMNCKVVPKLVPPAKIEQQPEVKASDFHWQMSQDAMATEKLAEGIRLFAKDNDVLCQKIEQVLKDNHLSYSY